jgi:hypothetical protein
MVLAESRRMLQMRPRDVLRLIVLPAIVVIVLVARVMAVIWWGGR